MLGNLFGPKCHRCGEKNAKQAEFCEHCGISLAFARPAILKDNRWEAAQDELAVFFMSRNLKGLFTKPLHVPAGMQAWILQENEVTDLKEGEYTVETLPERINSFFRGQHAEILIARQAAMPVKFVFDDIHSAELLPVTVDTTLFVKIGDKTAFRNHFMLSPGAVSSTQLRDLMKDSVRQIVAETLGARRLEEMSAQGNCRKELDEVLLRKLTHRFKDYGLAFDQVDTLSLRHDRFDANRQLKGSCWLEYDEARQKADHKKAMNELYSREELDKISAREEDLRHRYRNAELQQNEYENAHVIRLRELDLYEKVANADTREKAIDIKAREQVEWLEHEYNDRRLQREKNLLKVAWQQDDAQTEWRHTQSLARIRRDAEQRVAEVQRNEAEALERQRIANSLVKMQIQARIEQTKLVDDEAIRKEREAADAALLLKSIMREEQILFAKNQLAVDEVMISGDTHKREVARIAAWEDKLLEEKIAEADARIATTNSHERLSGLEKLIDIGEKYEQSKIRTELERVKNELYKREKEQAIKDAAEEKALERKLKEQKEDRAKKLEDNSAEIEKMRVLGSLKTEAILTLADAPEKIKALVELANTKALGDMEPEQIQAILASRQPIREAATNQHSFHSATPLSTSDPLFEEIRSNRDKQENIFNQLSDRLDARDQGSQATMLKMAAMIKDAAVDTARAVAAGPAGPVRVAQVDPAPSASPQFAATPALLIFKVCQACRRNNLPDAQFCGGCKESLL